MIKKNKQIVNDIASVLIKNDSTEDDFEFVINEEKELIDYGIFYLTGNIEHTSLSSLQQKILIKHINNQWIDDICIFINSYGGSCDEMWGLVDIMQYVKMDIRTIAIGTCMSAGTYILAAGTKGKRYIFPNTSLMVHEATTSFMPGGNLKSIKASNKYLELQEEKDIQFWIKYSSLKTEKQVRGKILNHVDNYITAKEAINFGIADYIINNFNDIDKKNKRSHP